MNTSHSIEEVQAFIAEERQAGKKIAFVPTMGALHDGHISLVHAAKNHGTSCVMSIFVNPTQFGPNEDFEKYPRTLDTDKNFALVGGVNHLFVPSVETVYPNEEKNFIDPPAHMNEVLCGPFRPGHFRGVCTVVHRLLDIVQPNELYLGQKDAQQLRIVQEVMRTLHPKTSVIGVPTFREKNGLAMSSRNKYLSPEDKDRAAVISHALTMAKAAYDFGERSVKILLHVAHEILEKESKFKIQYLELVQWEDFQKPEMVLEDCLLAVAGYFGETRLIDNVMLKLS